MNIYIYIHVYMRLFVETNIEVKRIYFYKDKYLWLLPIVDHVRTCVYYSCWHRMDFRLVLAFYYFEYIRVRCKIVSIGKENNNCFERTFVQCSLE